MGKPVLGSNNRRELVRFAEERDLILFARIRHKILIKGFYPGTLGVPRIRLVWANELFRRYHSVNIIVYLILSVFFFVFIRLIKIIYFMDTLSLSLLASSGVSVGTGCNVANLHSRTMHDHNLYIRTSSHTSFRLCRKELRIHFPLSLYRDHMIICEICQV